MLPELKDCILDHVAIAVTNLEEQVQFYQQLGLVFSKEREIVADQKVKTAFAAIDMNAHIELLESTDPDGPIGKYIDKKGPGIHHICFQVDNIERKQDELEKKGIRFLYPEPKLGAKNCIVNFIHPKSAGGVLIELSQASK